jgi:hypothetical protein
MFCEVDRNSLKEDMTGKVVLASKVDLAYFAATLWCDFIVNPLYDNIDDSGVGMFVTEAELKRRMMDRRAIETFRALLTENILKAINNKMNEVIVLRASLDFAIEMIATAAEQLRRMFNINDKDLDPCFHDRATIEINVKKSCVSCEVKGREPVVDYYYPLLVTCMDDVIFGKTEVSISEKIVDEDRENAYYDRYERLQRVSDNSSSALAMVPRYLDDSSRRILRFDELSSLLPSLLDVIFGDKDRGDLTFIVASTTYNVSKIMDRIAESCKMTLANLSVTGFVDYHKSKGHIVIELPNKKVKFYGASNSIHLRGMKATHIIQAGDVTEEFEEVMQGIMPKFGFLLVEKVLDKVQH